MTEQPDFNDDAAIEKVQRIATLIAGYLRQSLTPAEHDELDEWVGESDTNMKIFEELTDEEKLKEGLEFIENAQTAKMRKKLKEQLTFNRPRPRFSVMQYAVAASILLFLGISGYLFYRNNDKKPNHIAEIVEQHQDLQPGRDKAVLTLADGTVINLTDSKDGNLATQGNSNVVKENGQLVYNNQTTVASAEAPLFNTITTPRGGGYPLVLSDGTKIWLNAASSITYPSVFTGKDRKVAVTGEAYFEVAKNKAMPFIVDIKDRGTTVQVLGTHFNINAYPDDPVVKTTLLEGSVKIVNQATAASKAAFLKPGQQALVNDAGININSNVDIDVVMAWRNGMFRFNGTDLHSIMKQLGRWYDVDIEFQTTANPGYSSIFSRNLPASKIFAVLEENGGVHFKIEGKKVIVLP